MSVHRISNVQPMANITQRHSSQKTILASVATVDSVTPTIRDVANLPATVTLYSPCNPSVNGAKSWSYRGGVLQISVKDPSIHIGVSEVTISRATLTTLTTLSQPNTLADSQWMLWAVAAIGLGLATVVLIVRSPGRKVRAQIQSQGKTFLSD